MDHSPFVSLLGTEAPAGLLIDLLQLNARAAVLLILCFLVLRTVKASAAARHFLAGLALLSIALLPLSSQLIPAIDVTIETPVPAESGVAVVDHSATDTGRSYATPIFTPDLVYLGCLAIYLLGFAVLMANTVLSNLKWCLLINFCRPVTRSNWLAITERYRKGLGIRRRIDLRYSDINTSPSTWGALRPVILLPAGALDWPDHLIQSTVLHELAHIKRYDWLVQQITRCICAAYWLNPLCWIAAHRVFTDAETACDDMAINAGVRNVHYARSLVDVAKQALQHRHCRPAVLTMASREKPSQLNDRILAVLNRRAHRTPLTGRQIVLILLAFMFVLPVASVRANFVEKPTVREPFDTSLDLSNKPIVKDTVGEKLRATDGIDAIPVDIVSRKETGKANEKSETPEIADKLSELKQILRSNPVPPAHTSTTNRVRPILEPSDKPIKENLTQRLALDSKALEQVAIEESVSGPFRKNLVIPDYPRRALSRGIEGKVTVEYAVDRHGKVVDAQIRFADPDRIFNRKVLKAIKESTFNPRTVGGSPVPADGLMETYVFVLKS